MDPLNLGQFPPQLMSNPLSPDEVPKKLQLLTTSWSCPGLCRPSMFRSWSALSKTSNKRRSGKASHHLQVKRLLHRLWFIFTILILPSVPPTLRITTRTTPRKRLRKIPQAIATFILNAAIVVRNRESALVSKTLSCRLFIHMMHRMWWMAGRNGAMPLRCLTNRSRVRWGSSNARTVESNMQQVQTCHDISR